MRDSLRDGQQTRPEVPGEEGNRPLGAEASFDEG